ncbi:MAG: GIY-YIG nuclease family protein [Candidatus Omnitrophica bacterium]|nr:GIY-YIG nuclease family protein [Candidatus Omnitrophota bacterium]
MKKWFLYIVKCKDSSLYTGITTNLEKRVKRHNEGMATKYTRGRKPVKLVYSKACSNESSARKKEIELKKLPRKKKLELINKVL